MTPNEFIAKYGAMARESQIKSGIPASVTLAQAILESGWGKSLLTREANNFFGIKAGGSWKGPVYRIRTAEQNSNGSIYYVVAPFRKYTDAEEGFLDHARLFYRVGVYRPALAKLDDWKGFLRAIHGKYATDIHYYDKIAGLIEKYNLTQFDVPRSEWKLLPEFGGKAVEPPKEPVVEEKDELEFRLLRDDGIWEVETDQRFVYRGLVFNFDGTKLWVRPDFKK